MKRFLAFWTLVYLWSVETLYHVLVGLCWFHQGPSFSDGCLLLFSSVYIRCQDGLSAPTVFNGSLGALLLPNGPIAPFLTRVDGIQLNELVNTILNGLISILISWMILRLGSGWLGTMLDGQQLITPNQGIWRSARNAVFAGLVSGLGIGLVSTLGFSLGFGLLQSFSAPFSSYLMSGLDFGMFLGLFSASFTGLRYGGSACIEHITLRLLLWYAKAAPWHYSRFLDYAAECILLRKVGGGYIFLHRLLLNYFASLDTSSTFDPVPRQTQKTLTAQNEM